MATDTPKQAPTDSNAQPTPPGLDMPLPISPMHIFAAMLDAARSSCTCAPCKVLRQAADTLSTTILASPAGGTTP